MIKKYFKNINKQKGYTLLFAVIVSSIVLSVGASIMNISKKETILASSVRDSITAFYAADSGLECAIYQNVNFSTSTTAVINFGCLGQVINLNPIPIVNSFGESDGSAKFEFAIKIGGTESNACANIYVLKHYVLDRDLGEIPETIIESRGYNLGWNSSSNTCDVNGPRRVERAIRYTL